MLQREMCVRERDVILLYLYIEETKLIPALDPIQTSISSLCQPSGNP